MYINEKERERFAAIVAFILPECGGNNKDIKNSKYLNSILGQVRLSAS